MVGCVQVKCMDNTSSRNPWTSFLVIVGICALKDTQIMSKKELQWEFESRSCWSFRLSLTFWILLDLKYLSFPPFFLSSLLTLWAVLFSLICKKGNTWHHRSNSIRNSRRRYILQGRSIPDSFDMPCVQARAILRVSRTTPGCSLHFWLDFSSLFCSVLPHKCVAREWQCHSFTAELSHPLLHEDPR